MSTDTTIPVIGIAVTIVNTIVTCAIMMWSVRVVMRQLRAGYRLHRRELHAATTEVTDQYIATCLLHWRDHFDEQIYRKYYEGCPVRCRSYLIMKRKYMYLVFQAHLKDTFGKAARHWLKELVCYREFRDIHVFHAHYYSRQFQKVVDKQVKTSTCMGWFCESVEPDDPVTSPARADGA